MTRVFSGIQPTGAKHLGNLLGAMRWWVEGQYDSDAFYCVVDLHALTVPKEPDEVRNATLSITALLLAAGIDPERCTLFVQSHVPEHTQLTWLLECTASFGELRRMTQFKEKLPAGGESAARAGLFTYPVLQAADILLYDSDQVPVGDDQRQHVELARDLAQRFNHRYGAAFVVPEATIPSRQRGARIMDLQNPTNKMSTSADSDQGVILLLDDPKAIERKITRAVTDADPADDPVRYDPDAKPGVATLLELLAIATGRDVAAVASDYTRYGPLKADTAAAVIAMLEPLQRRYQALIADPAGLTKVLADGALRAGEVASATYGRARDAIGLLPPG